MKRMCMIILLLCLLPFCSCAKKYEDRIEMGDYILESVTEERNGKIVATGKYRILDYKGEEEEVVVPSKTDQGAPIIEVGAWAFASNQWLRTITVSDGIKSIEKKPFMAVQT